ncbi:MAG: hypothetical protein J6V88_02185 [Kiritimatiellae bacterium]|nr:hypothetical protein [Kiritimatiellia bacterium]
MIELRNIFFAFVAMVASATFGAFSIEEWMSVRNDDSDMLRLRTAYRECASRVKEEVPAENVQFPIENYPNGTSKIRLRAARGQMFPEKGYIWAENIVVEQFDENGKLTGSIKADNCVVDRKSKTGWVEGSAVMTYGESSVKGRGIYFSFTREFIKIFTQSEITTKSFSWDDKKEIFK